MPIYTYTAWDEHAAPRGGAIAAENLQDARLKLKRMRLYVTSIIGPGTSPVVALLRLLIGRRRA